jgi:hypothetical protein
MEMKYEPLSSEQNSNALESLIVRLDRNFYDAILALCTAGQHQSERLKLLEIHQSTSQYITLCNRLVEEIRHFIKAKKEYLLPYLRTLSRKDSEAHDCRNCTGTGSCNLQHSMMLSELTESHVQIKDILHRLQMVVLPLYSDTIYPEVYRALRNQMALLENSLGELYFVEEAYLVPQVMESQKNIHVRD